MNKPKTPHKHAAIIRAWADGLDIQTFSKIDNDWRDKDEPHWDVDREYRVKPEPVPHADLKNAHLNGTVIEVLINGVWVVTHDPNWWENYQYRIQPSYPKTLIEDLASIAYPNRSHTVPLLREVANAAIARAIDDGQVVVPPNDADTSTYRWMGHTAREWQELCAIAEKRLEDSKIVDASFDPDFQEVKDQRDPAELARSSCRALCEYLGKTRDDVTFDQIAAIVLLERLKP